MAIKEFPTPILGFCAFSGTGKTTLLTKLIPILADKGLRLAIIKHAHHEFDVDNPEKDSYKLRHAGATQMLISSARRWALMRELKESEHEFTLQELLEQIDHANSDLVLVEGFKKEAFNKIELHRPLLGHPLMCGSDTNVIAVAVDDDVNTPEHLPRLDLNNPQEITDFICRYFDL
ncbi:MAG: molybdopterin-guanine dinucleotide biosynthesis protein B [Pseudomonadota bacterium]